ncbi:DNA gyrase/topoisomerase IV subunit B [Butyricicoccus porcorum]|uniref:DNA topoisomerase (ATP-hydrolyzing) n=1 Tax=Butyricicoccus porcorum TaxID=1945634 RepID=A0A252F7J5_9FIRM|nr:toprim domain-containing protein [Butyricicoccus porcorum]MCI6927520.1 toprim domain-containing protein [Butyricicoccus porcorum]MDD6986258.1 toprim domain-containing protein [Butyricicoccus porcorum]MDY4483018.1 toprim domain-containing protein [Butyricicoccus porcorum]OUM21692.1 DNA topoisomerase [Butyricicoccus porcorum]
MKKANQYGNESISALKGADRVRKRPGVIFGSDGLDGCQHAVFEILSNSIDEAREGYGSEITVTRFADYSIEVEDHGRGIPVDFNPNEKRYNWELVFCELYAGGKYKTNDGENYEFSLGLNGLGTCATQYSSEYMDVMVRRDGTEYTLHFEKGENQTGTKTGFKKKKYDGKDTGTMIRWRPDLEVFTDISIPESYYLDVLKRQAVVNPHLKFIFRNQTETGFTTTEFCYENGITDYVAEIAEDRALTSIQSLSGERRGRDRADKPEYKVRLNCAFCFSSSVSRLEYYHNSSWLEYGGAPDKAVRSAFVYAIDAYLKQNGKYNKNESRISFQDVSDSLILVTSCFSTYTSYENQTKKAITNKFIQEAMTEFLRSGLEIYFIENKAEADKIAEQILINKRSREQAEKARLNIRKKLSGSIDVANRVQKFVDCRTRDVSRRELYIVEGDSALGSCKQGRDSEFQAIMPIRGKILNCLKADYDKIFKNDIITDLLKVLGCGVEVKSKASKDLSTFDLNNLRWNKVIICTDADVDGFQIRTLVLTMLYRLVPTLIEEGYVYIAESPLYEITCKNKSYFAFDESEKADILKELAGKKYTIQRSKGLGENEADMMWETTMNPESRRLIRVLPEDAAATSEMFDLLLGENLSGRKEYIAENGWQYLEFADIS